MKLKINIIFFFVCFKDRDFIYLYVLFWKKLSI